MRSKEKNQPKKKEDEDTVQTIQIREGLNIKEISDQLEVKAKDILTLLKREGFSITGNDSLT
ncbi:MAG: hypothetical protein V3R45_09095, partial [Candidatus Aminicenantaceae bacterium]